MFPVTSAAATTTPDARAPFSDPSEVIRAVSTRRTPNVPCPIYSSFPPTPVHVPVPSPFFSFPSNEKRGVGNNRDEDARPSDHPPSSSTPASHPLGMFDSADATDRNAWAMEHPPTTNAVLDIRSTAANAGSFPNDEGRRGWTRFTALLLEEGIVVLIGPDDDVRDDDDDEIDDEIDDDDVRPPAIRPVVDDDDDDDDDAEEGGGPAAVVRRRDARA